MAPSLFKGMAVGGRDLRRFCDSWKAKVVVELRSSIGAANKGSIRLNRVNWEKLAKLNKLISSALIESNQLKLQIIDMSPPCMQLNSHVFLTTMDF